MTYRRLGKTNMMITRFETTCLKQKGDLDARSIHTLIGHFPSGCLSGENLRQ